LQALRILYVEDHSDTRMVLARLLVRYGYSVFTAANVHDALDLLDALAFDVLLSDIGLPDGNGFELATQARQRQPLRCAVALTAYASDEDREHGFRAGFDRYLTKPLDLAVLQNVLSQLG
jgi:CheY-like chemotaxis protein